MNRNFAFILVLVVVPALMPSLFGVVDGFSTGSPGCPPYFCSFHKPQAFTGNPADFSLSITTIDGLVNVSSVALCTTYQFKLTGPEFKGFVLRGSFGQFSAPWSDDLQDKNSGECVTRTVSTPTTTEAVSSWLSPKPNDIGNATEIEISIWIVVSRFQWIGPTDSSAMTFKIPVDHSAPVGETCAESRPPGGTSDQIINPFLAAVFKYSGIGLSSTVLLSIFVAYVVHIRMKGSAMNQVKQLSSEYEMDKLGKNNVRTQQRKLHTLTKTYRKLRYRPVRPSMARATKFLFGPWLFSSWLDIAVVFLIFTILGLLWTAFFFEHGTAGAAFGYLAMILYGAMLLPMTRNSLFSKLFGLPFDRIVKFHRIGARTGLVCAISHTIIKIVKYGWHIIDVKDLTRYGYAPLIGMFLGGLTFFLSFEIVRRKKFELFYYTHPLALASLIGSCIHRPELVYYLAPGIGLWIIDRLFRAYKSRRKVTIRSIAESGDHVRITFQQRGFNEQSHGVFAFVSCPSISWDQWHPICIVPTQSSMRNKTSPAMLDMYVKALGPKSWTRRLLGVVEDYLMDPSIEKDRELQDPPCQLAVKVDGPYGSIPYNVGDFESVMFIAGGSGFLALLSQIRACEMSPKIRERRRQTYVVWTVKKPEHTAIVAEELLEIAQYINVYIFITDDDSLPNSFDISDSVRGHIKVHIDTRGSEPPSAIGMLSPSKKYLGSIVGVDAKPDLEKTESQLTNMRSSKSGTLEKSDTLQSLLRNATVNSPSTPIGMKFGITDDRDRYESESSLFNLVEHDSEEKKFTNLSDTLKYESNHDEKKMQGTVNYYLGRPNIDELLEQWQRSAADIVGCCSEELLLVAGGPNKFLEDVSLSAYQTGVPFFSFSYEV